MEKSEEAVNSQPPVYVVQQQQPQPQQTYAVPYQNPSHSGSWKNTRLPPMVYLEHFYKLFINWFDSNFSVHYCLGMWAYVIFSFVSTALAVSRAVNSNSG
ncbi:unnamed protein product [Rotaria socialis]|nr:unnamed protein product [Rotaria socialis]CAF4445230.1 unnamed protein product [Rotaria socialis]CAF4670541.1 unnamed protein product [Rotaria socialis]